jgi:hypothetical protein
LQDSDASIVLSSFRFDAKTGALADFSRDDAMNAIAQLRDMHGFKAVTKIAPTSPDGEGPARMIVQWGGNEAPSEG